MKKTFFLLLYLLSSILALNLYAMQVSSYNYINKSNEIHQVSNNKTFCKQYLAGHTYKGVLVGMAGANAELNQVMKTLKVYYIIQFINENQAKLIIEATPIESYKYDVTARMFAEMLSSKSCIEEYSYSNGKLTFAGDEFIISKDKKQLSTTENMVCTLNRIK